MIRISRVIRVVRVIRVIRVNGNTSNNCTAYQKRVNEG